MEVFYEGVVAGNSANVAADGSVTEFIAAPGAEFQVFEVGDASRTTPLPVKVGGRTTTTIRTSDRSVMPDVHVTSDSYKHVFKSGTFEWERLSNDGMQKAADEARTAAQQLAAEVPGLIVAGVESVAATGAFKGEPGKDGSNVVPTAQAIATEIQTPGTPANTALSATFVALENVKKYGAKGDGVTDDTAAINAAIAALKQKLDLGTNGVTKFVPPSLYFPAGAYKCSSALTTIDFKYLTMRGDGMEASVLHWDGAGPLISLGAYTANGGYGGNGSNFSMRNMQVLSPAQIFLTKEGARTGIAIQDNGSGGVTLEDVKLRGFKYGFNGAYGSDFDSFIRPHFANCDVGAYFGPGSQQIKIDTPNAEYCREAFVIEGAPHGSLKDGWFVLNSYSDITFEGNTTARSGIPGQATGGQYDMAWTIEDCWHETDAGGLGRVAPRMIMIQGAPPAAMKNVKILRPYMVAGGTASSTDTFLEVATTGANAVAKILLESLSVNGGHLGSLVKPTSGLTSIRVRNASITDGYTMPPVFSTKAAGYVYVDEANKYVQGSNNSAFTEIRDNTGALDVRTRLLQNADTSLSVLFWTGSAYVERLRLDTQNSRVYLGNALDAYIGRLATKVVGVGPDQGFRVGVFTTANRPSATDMGAGTQIYDSTLTKPLWSDGAAWRDAMGAAA